MKDDSLGLEDVLRDLPRRSSDVDRSARVRAKCHQALRRHPARRLVASIIVGGFCAAYLTLGATVVVAVYAAGATGR